ncbi:MAG: hypothetical protein QXS54_03005 [Candidatus Methanomethylicaceae archaeon]
MPKGGERTIYAKINLKGGAILFERKDIIIRDGNTERRATPTEAKLARAVARYRSLWLKQLRSRHTHSAEKHTSQKVDTPDYFFTLLAACVRARDAIKARRYDSALELLQAAIERATTAS